MGFCRNAMSRIFSTTTHRGMPSNRRKTKIARLEKNVNAALSVFMFRRHVIITFLFSIFIPQFGE